MSQQNDPFGLVGHVLAQKYRVDAVVGEGGFGVVYRGYHLSFQHDVAVKCLKIPPHFTTETQALFVKRFRDEGQHLSRLSSAHMSIVRVFDFDIATSPNGATVPYLVLEWLQGKPLDVVLAERREVGVACFGEREALTLLRPAVEALALAHDLGVVHRDIKPGNLFVVEGPGATVKVLDFGIAKATEDGATAAQAGQNTTGMSPFSPMHGAPEQFSPKRFGATGPWTDVHALGLLLVEMVSGKPPFDGDELGEMFLAATAEARPTPRARGANVSDELEALCARAVALQPRDRFGSARELLEGMDAAAADGVVRTVPAAVMMGPQAGVDTGPSAMALPPTTGPSVTQAAPQAPSFVPAGTAPAPYVPQPTPTGQTGSRRKPGRGRLVALVGAGIAIVGGGALFAWLFAWNTLVDGARRDCRRGKIGACEEACDLGHAPSCATVGRRLLLGEGVTRNEPRAVDLLRRACTPRETAGCGALGIAYERARGGLAKDDKRAAELYQRGCDANDLAACASLGLVLERGGGGLARDDKRAVKLYQRACDGSALLGCTALGRAYEKGRGGLPKEERRAVALFQQACDGGELRGCNGLGYAYERGQGGLPKDPKHGVELYRHACDGGEMRGCTNLGYAYERALGGLAKDAKRAVELYQRACDGGDVGACANLGVDYERGQGGLPRDERRAVELYQRACDGGAIEGCTNLGFSYERGTGGLPKDPKRAAELYQRACDDTTPEGCNNLAVFYAHAEGPLRDERRAVDLYRRACDAGEMIACSNLGFQHEHAKGGLPRNVDKAVELYRRACDGGEMDGCNRLGVAHEQGKGALPHDAKRAVDLYQRACNGGSMGGCYHLGLAYQQGKGGLPQDDRRAVALFQRACDGGAMMGCQNLGLAYERGTGGLTADKTRAAELYQRACSGGHQYSCEAMKRLGAAPRR